MLITDQKNGSRKTLKNSGVLVAVLLVSLTIYGQENTPHLPATYVALKAENWEFQPQKVEFLEYKSRPAMKILPNAGPVILKTLDFSSGTLEFDIEPLDPRFATIYFRWQNAGEN